eukprot:TRINITY_DN7139_c0_g1_i1.p1 TRINITY_DN7139_c0_g1~~TRINITY_DN7139_c0_g1_i1.p1  ORF type:complete len:453 (-),score=86.88 TRINITY_DN7139_c0_g1_i1:101-1459(-)
MELPHDLYQKIISKTHSIIGTGSHPNVLCYTFCEEKDRLLTLTYSNVQLNMFYPGACHVKNNILGGDAFSERSGKLMDLVSGIIWLHQKNIYDVNLIPDHIVTVGTQHPSQIYNCTFSPLFNYKKELLEPCYRVFLAPEKDIGGDRDFGPEVDVWSVGVYLSWIVANKSIETKESLVNLNYKSVAPTLWEMHAEEEVANRLIQLVNMCLSLDPRRRPLLTFVLEELRRLTVEAVIFDPLGREFWIKYFPDAVSVNLDLFVEKFIEHFKIPLERHVKMKIRAFRFLLTVGQTFKNGQAKMAEFSRILQWFGPLKVHEDGPDHILTRLEWQLAKESFHGPIEWTDAEALLKPCQDKSYLIRFSGSVPGTYAISIKSGTKYIHYRLFHRPGGMFHLGNDQEGKSTLEDLLLELKKDSVPFLYPIGGSLYGILFSDYASKHHDYVRPSLYTFDFYC